MRLLCQLVSFLVLLLVAGNAYASTVRNIQIEGNQRIEVETIHSYLTFKEGDTITTDSVNQSLKALFSTGLFADVTITPTDNDVLIKVEENPVINEITFEGNKRIKEDVLIKEVNLQPRSVYTQAKVQADVTRLLAVYQKSGRFSVAIVPKITELSQNRVNLVFEIDEGSKATIREISFVGNSAFSDSKLAGVIQSKEARWYRFFSGDDTYDPDRLAFDQELLRKFYISHGYADFKVNSAIAEISPDKEGFYVTFSIDEGTLYRFGDINVHTTLKNLDTAALKASVVKTIPGETFNAELIESSVEKIVEKLSELGYAFVDIDPEFSRDTKNNTIGVTYQINEGPKVYVERINVTGNVRTMDKVVRREFRIAEGDPYNAAMIRRSQQRIRNLGFFEKVDIQTAQGSAPDKALINAEVAERSTGELNFGAGFSTTDGALVNASIRERNLLGKGQDLRFSIQRATKGLEVDLSFTEPYFMDKDVAVGFDVFKITRDHETESSYDSDAKGITLRATYSVTELLRHTVKYSVRTDDITNISTDASRFIRDQEGMHTTSLVGHTLMYDTRDTRFDPTEGYSIRFSQDLAGLGGDSQFLRNELRTDYYHPLFLDNVILGLSGKAGYIFGVGKDVRINERFFLGGNDLRGFKTAGIGPRDQVTTDALGGNIYYAFGPEVTFPLGLPEELGFKGAVFVDAGGLTDVDDTGPEVVDENSLRASAGMGVAWSSPLGPIRIDYATPFMKESFDKLQELRFSFGTRF